MIGIEVVAALAASDGPRAPGATITATCWRTSFSHNLRQPVSLILCPPVFYLDVLTLEMTGFSKAIPKGIDENCSCFGGAKVDESNHRHCWLLRACRERPRRRAAKKIDEFAPSHEVASGEAHSLAHHRTTRAPVQCSEILLLMSVQGHKHIVMPCCGLVELMILLGSAAHCRG